MGEGALGASSVAELFFDNIVAFFTVPSEVSSDRYSCLTTSFG